MDRIHNTFSEIRQDLRFFFKGGKSCREEEEVAEENYFGMYYCQAVNSFSKEVLNLHLFRTF